MTNRVSATSFESAQHPHKDFLIGINGLCSDAAPVANEEYSEGHCHSRGMTREVPLNRSYPLHPFSCGIGVDVEGQSKAENLTLGPESQRSAPANSFNRRTTGPSQSPWLSISHFCLSPSVCNRNPKQDSADLNETVTQHSKDVKIGTESGFSGSSKIPNSDGPYIVLHDAPLNPPWKLKNQFLAEDTANALLDFGIDSTPHGDSDTVECSSMRASGACRRKPSDYPSFVQFQGGYWRI